MKVFTLRFISLILSVLLAFSLVSCGGAGDDSLRTADGGTCGGETWQNEMTAALAEATDRYFINEQSR